MVLVLVSPAPRMLPFIPTNTNTSTNTTNAR